MCDCGAMAGTCLMTGVPTFYEIGTSVPNQKFAVFESSLCRSIVDAEALD